MKRVFPYHKKLKNFLIVKPSCATQEQARAISNVLSKPVIYIEDLNGITSYEKDETLKIINGTHS